MRGSGIYTSDFVRSMDCEGVLPCSVCDGDDPAVDCPEGGDHGCQFSGPVDITVSDYGEGFWWCPVCGHEHENVELDDPYDYEDRDR
jgi:hypothetical protein